MNISRDILWKGIIEDLFEDFLWYFLPDLAENEVDFGEGFEFLDKELAALLPENERRKRHADKLVKFFTKAGKPHYILLHIEVQGYDDAHFAKRMFEYYYRIRDRWHVPVCAFVLYTNENTAFQPIFFEERHHKTRLLYEFPVFTLVGKVEQDLEVPKNPFSLVMKVAHKALQKKQRTDNKQLIWKMELVRELYKAGYAREKIQYILTFIRLYVRFAKPDKEVVLEKDIEIFTKPPKPMGIIEAVLAEARRIGEEEGKAEGKAEGEAKGKKEDAFGMFDEGLSLEAVVRITKLPYTTIQAWEKEWGKTK